MLEVRHLDAHYGDFQALFDVSLTVNPGEVLALIGANAAGKSTLLKAICGLLPVERQAISWKGDPIGGWRPTPSSGVASPWCRRDGGCSRPCRWKRT